MRATITLINGGLQTRVTVVNTKIGGVSGAISTAALLATKLGINVDRISDFAVTGADIECSISGQYVLPGSVFAYDTNISYYRDYNNLMTSLSNIYTFWGCTNLTELMLYGTTIIGSTSFSGTSKLSLLYFPNALTVLASAFNESLIKTIYVPLATVFGATPADSSVFYSGNAGSTIYCHPSLATNNAGGEDGDIVYARSIGCTIRFVLNFTNPLDATVSNIGTINNTSIKMIDPGTSTNAIDYYEVSVNGGAIRKIPINQYITALTKNTSHALTITAIDVFLNKSNTVVLNVTTANTASTFPVTGLKSYYRLDENTGTIAYDSFGTDNLTNTNVLINKVGKITNAYQSTASGQSLTTTSGTAITGTFTINLWVYRTATAQTYSALYDQGNFNDNTGFGVWCNSSGYLSWRINQNFNHFNAVNNLPLNTWTMVTVVYNGVNVKTYLDAVLKTTDAMTTNPTTSTKKSIFYGHNGAMFFGKENDISIHNIELLQSDINTIYNAGTGITL